MGLLLLFLSSAAAVDGATVASAGQLFEPVLAEAVAGTTVASAAQLFAPVVGGAIDGITVASAAQLFAPVVTAEQAVSGATLASASQLFAPVADEVIVVRRGPLFARYEPPSQFAAQRSQEDVRNALAILYYTINLDSWVDTEFLDSADQLYPPTVAGGAEDTAATGATIASTLVLHPPILPASQPGSGDWPNPEWQPYPPALLVHPLPSRLPLVAPPGVWPEFIESTEQLYAPTLGGFATWRRSPMVVRHEEWSRHAALHAQEDVRGAFIPLTVPVLSVGGATIGSTAALHPPILPALQPGSGDWPNPEWEPYPAALFVHPEPNRLPLIAPPGVWPQHVPSTSEVFGPSISSLAFMRRSPMLAQHERLSDLAALMSQIDVTRRVVAGPTPVAGATIASGSVVFPPVVSPAGVINIVGDTVATTAQLFAPTLTVGAVTVVGSNIPTTVALFAPTLAAAGTGATIPVGSVVNPPAVAPGAVTVTGGTVATTVSLFPPVVAVAGVTSVTGETIAAASVVHAPSVAVGAVTILGATITTSAQLNGPSLALNITTGTVSSATVLRAPTVAPGPASVGGSTVDATSEMFLPIISPAGVTNIGSTTRASTLVLHAPSVTVGPVSVVEATIGSTLQIFEPTIAPGPVSVTAGTRPATSSVTAPSVAPGAVTVLAQTVASSTVLHVPTLAAAGTGATVASTAVLFAPSITVGPVEVLGAHIGSTSQLFVPTRLTPPPMELVGTYEPLMSLEGTYEPLIEIDGVWEEP